MERRIAGELTEMGCRRKILSWHFMRLTEGNSQAARQISGMAFHGAITWLRSCEKNIHRHTSLLYRLPDTSEGRIRRITDIPDAQRLIEEQNYYRTS